MEIGEEVVLSLPICQKCNHNLHLINDQTKENELGDSDVLTMFCFFCGNTLTLIGYPEIDRNGLFLDKPEQREGKEKTFCLWTPRTKKRIVDFFN